MIAFNRTLEIFETVFKGSTLKLQVRRLKFIRPDVTVVDVDAGQIDVLVNNAGRGLVGAIEETSTEEVRSIFAVNVEGILKGLPP